VKRGTGGGRVAWSVPLLALAACLGATLTAASAASAAKSPATKITVYSIATQEQFLNHEDDRDRGKGNNPFGNFKDSTSATKETGVGPFAGDRAVFTFKLYKSAAMRSQVGSAQFICQYGFDKNAFCNAAYQLKDGQIVGEGEFNFNASTFSLVIVGGTGKYRGLTGDMGAVPAVQHTQKLQFTLR
jgi:hypothetical protein